MAILALVAVGVAALVPAPWLVVRPLDPLDARELVARPDRPSGATGRMLIPVVDAHRAKWIEAAWYGAVGGARLTPVEDSDRAAQEHGNLPARRLFDESPDIALLAAARLAQAEGLRSTGSGVRVLAEGRNRSRSPLRSGDVVVEVEGASVRTYEDLAEALRKLPYGETFQVTLAGQREPTSLPPLRATPADRAHFVPFALGMAAVETDRPQVTVPGFSWAELPPYSGPSSGLGLAVAAWERLTGRGLDLDGSVLVTGEIGSDGSVRGVGDVALKARSARAGRAKLLLVPSQNAREARANAGPVRVVAVDSLRAAVAALERNDQQP